MGKRRTKQELWEEALKYKSRMDFYENSNPEYQSARRRGLLDEICSHMGKEKRKVRAGKVYRKWTENKIILEALKFKNKTDFIENSWGAYQAARNLGILDKVCAHMPKHRAIPEERQPEFKWTPEKVREEALKYSNRDNFKEFSPGAWCAAQRSGTLSLVCSHMKWGGSSSKPEIFLFFIS